MDVWVPKYGHMLSYFSLGLCVMSVKTVKILQSKVYGDAFIDCLSEKLF